jgi:hypothetical protein
MDMKLGIWYFIPDQVKCADRDVHSLVPAQRSGIKDDELAVVATSAPALKNGGIREIQDSGTFAGQG